MPDAQAALEDLADLLVPPERLRPKEGQNDEDAQDLVQGFFGQLLSRRDLADVHPDKGRFRRCSQAAGHYLANEWHRAHALKRGGATEFVALEATDPEGRYLREPASDASPEVIYDRAWANQLLSTVLSRLRAEASREGSLDRFEALKGFLLGERGGEPYADLASRLGMTESSIKSAVTDSASESAPCSARKSAAPSPPPPISTTNCAT